MAFRPNLYYLIIFKLSENHTENCDSFDFQRGSLACAISGNHIDHPVAKCINDCPTLLLQDLESSDGSRGGHAQRDVVKSQRVHLNFIFASLLPTEIWRHTQYQLLQIATGSCLPNKVRSALNFIANFSFTFIKFDSSQ